MQNGVTESYMNVRMNDAKKQILRGNK